MKHLLPNGRSILATTISIYESVFSNIVVIVKDNQALPIEEMETSKTKVLECRESSEGMGRTIACGIKHIGNAKSVLIALGDMPYVSVKTVALMKEKMQSAGIVVPYYNGQRGNPIGFGSFYFEQLCKLRGDKGARDIIKNNSSLVDQLEVSDSGILRDIDTPTDIL